MKKTLLCGALLLTSVMPMAAQGGNECPDSVYLISYATQNPKEGIRLAYSIDKSRWIPIGDNYSVVRSDFGTWGAQKNMYTPSVLQDDGVFYAVWSLNDRSPQFATTKTTDFWLWKPQDYPYMHKAGSVLNPILMKYNGEFIVGFWNKEGKVFYTRSTDFKTWTEPEEVPNVPTDKMDEFIKYVRPNYLTVNVAGNKVSGDVHRVAWNVVGNLVTQVEAAAYRNQRNNERMADDATRFRNLQTVKANLNADLSSTKAISKDLIGIFFEDINYGADGGLYAELVQNRDFEYSKADRGHWNSQTAWQLKGEGTEWTISTTEPIHENNSHYAVLKTTKVGASLHNEGFGGIAVKQGEKYNLSLFLRKLEGKGGKVMVKLMDGETVLASAKLSVPAAWKQLKAVLTPKATANKATLVIEPLSEGTIGVDFVSLFPKNTFKNRPNGLRADLAQLLADMKPRFVRFPGGCATHGNGIDNIYHWKNTVGPLHHRKGDFNIWGYHQSMGLGFFEYFQFCEDIGAEPLPVLAAGVPCQNSSHKGDGQQGGIPWSEMDEYLQELLDLIEWANGDPKTSELAKMRADAGHPEPFNLKYLGIGNEDLISDVFTERYNYLCRAIRKQHPEITVVGTVGPFFEGSDYQEGWRIAKEEKLEIVDEHYYNTPGWFINNQNFYDKYERGTTKVYLGEYASKGNNLENALVEGLHITNLERNGDVVVMSSYAPLLAREGHTQWNPDLIYFNNTEVKPTVNYWVQQLCGTNAGSQYVNNVMSVDTHREDVRLRVGSSVVKDEETGDLIIKLVNCLPSDVEMKIALGSLDGYQTKAKCSLLTGKYDERNQRPTYSDIDVSADFTYTMPQYSFTVLRIPAIQVKKK